MTATSSTTKATTATVRQRIEGGGERCWRLLDFEDLPFAAVAQALSRLAHGGQLRRLSRGIYYRARKTTFGDSLPDPADLHAMAAEKAPVFPAGLGAASLLGFSTQVARRREVATPAASLPRSLLGAGTVVHTRRPAAWVRLQKEDGALLDFLRQAGRTTELTDEATWRRTRSLLLADGRLARLVDVAGTEPPRVRALLGALAEASGAKPAVLKRLRATLHPLSRFDFGVFAGLRTAKDWQAKSVGAA